MVVSHLHFLEKETSIFIVMLCYLHHVSLFGCVVKVCSFVKLIVMFFF